MLLSVVRRRILAAAVGFCTLAGGSAVHAGIAYTNPQASASAYAFNDQDTDAASGGGPLNLDAQASRSAQGSSATARAKAHYVLDQTGIHGDTHLTGTAATEPGALDDSTNYGYAQTDLELSFTIDQPYWATYSNTYGVVSDVNLREGMQTTFLIRDEPGATPLINTGMTSPNQDGYLLEPGTYKFNFEDMLLSNPYSANVEFTYSFDLELVPVSGGGGNENPAVPLPPAAWMGLITLGGIAVVQLRQHRAARLA